MKKLLIITLVLCCFGCTIKTNNTLENENSKAASFNAFNDESYVWESWTFSTNKVFKVK